jgi:hypothetical protein
MRAVMVMVIKIRLCLTLLTAMRIIAYTYDADIRCPDCARNRFCSPEAKQAPADDIDEHGLLLVQEDREGNVIHPVFSTDELGSLNHCADCHTEI